MNEIRVPEIENFALEIDAKQHGFEREEVGPYLRIALGSNVNINYRVNPAISESYLDELFRRAKHDIMTQLNSKSRRAQYEILVGAPPFFIYSEIENARIEIYPTEAQEWFDLIPQENFGYMLDLKIEYFEKFTETNAFGIATYNLPFPSFDVVLRPEETDE